MRNALLGAVLVVGCGSSSGPATTSSPADFPDDHKFHNNNEETDTALHVRLGGTQVPVAELPQVARRIGLPVSGTADIAVTMDIPKNGEDVDYTRARGSWSIACTACQVGDDKTRLNLGALIGGGVDVSHLTVDRLQATAKVTDGKLEVTRWELASPDLELDVALTVTFSPSSLFSSKVDGCIRFKPTPALEQRDPKLFAMLALTGAATGRDGRYHITLAGPLMEVRRIAKECGA